MSKATGDGKKALVPKLRFREFQDTEGWSVKRLGKLARKITAKNHGCRHTRVLTNSAEHGVVDQRDYFDKDIANSKNIGNYCIVEQGDYVYNPRVSTSAPVGPISRNNLGAGVMSPLYTVFRFDTATNEFFSHYFSSSRWHPYLQTVSNTGARFDRMAISSDDFMAMPLPCPLPREQQKIAACLSSLDALIQAHTDKLAALKTHKQGLLQQLFPRDGETVPRLRFPAFRNAGGWKERTLGKLTSIVRGGSPRPIDAFLTPDTNGLNWLKIGDVDRGAKYVKRTEEKVRPEALSKTRVIHPGDFILSNSMSFGRPYISTIDTCIHDGWIAVTKIPDSLDREFLYYLILSDGSQKYFADQAAGSGVQNLNKDIIKSLPLTIPSKAEQACIADCLSTLDTLITAQTDKIAALKQHKHGLLQQLFPAMDEAAA